MLVSQIQQAPTLYLLEVEVLVVASLEAEVAAVSVPFKESYHRLKKYDIMEDRKKTNYKKSQ
ncbi:Uncharacterised protein [Streptococcus pneumoniae]|nr:Uncharacterised protein [Streptococcus pneumoniae]CJH53238.1 Uncharacterised protein [Streptococcus pneumoniae]COL23640.1 Uncharacterised protein [Streptococcus pneumoniae]VPP39627.1 Uncharacterised protein [Streptococcus pneumoniae]VPY01609.1 Uncharacterised protein [Streptococcus pneumoniae]